MRINIIILHSVIALNRHELPKRGEKRQKKNDGKLAEKNLNKRYVNRLYITFNASITKLYAKSVTLEKNSPEHAEVRKLNNYINKAFWQQACWV